MKAELRNLGQPDAATLMQSAHLYPHQAGADSYTLPAYPRDTEAEPAQTEPVPPPGLWVNYGRSPEEYLETGRRDVEQMRAILELGGVPIDKATRILEFGCAAGRMIRWLDDLTPTAEIWGVDIWASAILWCKEYLSPPFHFATTTIAPHLPFEDHYFDFAFAGSIFTHIEDLTDAWFQELRRILRPGGTLYVTLNDRRAVAVLEGRRTPEESEYFYMRVGGKASWESFVDGWLRNTPGYRLFERGGADMVTISRSSTSNVLWDADFLCKRQAPFFRVISMTEKAYGHQTGVLLERV